MKYTLTTLCLSCRASGHRKNTTCWFCGSSQLIKSRLHGKSILSSEEKGK